jgi:hypothetical protein
MRASPIRRLIPVIAGTAFLACDAAAPPSYPGEPLLTVRGQVTSLGRIEIPLEAAMLWQRGEPPSTGDQELATRAPVQSGFPATFTLHLYQPPPAAALRTLVPGQVRYARANAAAIPYGIAAALGAPVATPPSNPSYGIDESHWVVYLESDVPAGSLMEWWLGSALPAGFHLLKVITVGDCTTGPVLDACVADLVQRGVTDDGTMQPGTARYFCTQPYRLAAASSDEELAIALGSATWTSGLCQP